MDSCICEKQGTAFCASCARQGSSPSAEFPLGNVKGNYFTLFEGGPCPGSLFLLGPSHLLWQLVWGSFHCHQEHRAGSTASLGTGRAFSSCLQGCQKQSSSVLKTPKSQPCCPTFTSCIKEEEKGAQFLRSKPKDDNSLMHGGMSN